MIKCFCDVCFEEVATEEKQKIMVAEKELLGFVDIHICNNCKKLLKTGAIVGRRSNGELVEHNGIAYVRNKKNKYFIISNNKILKDVDNE